jgi:steroid 5-alpha reductase family enzyme
MMLATGTSAALASLSHTGLVVGGCNMVGYAITAILETHKITDLVGAGSFVAATVSLSIKNKLFTLPISSPKLLLVNLGVILWGIRLASFLFYRVLQVGSDKRLNKFFRKPGEGYLDFKQSIFPLRLGIFWTIQSAWGILCLIPVALLNSIPQTLPDGTPNPLLQLSGDSPLQTGRYDIAISRAI